MYVYEALAHMLESNPADKDLILNEIVQRGLRQLQASSAVAEVLEAGTELELCKKMLAVTTNQRLKDLLSDRVQLLGA